MKELDLKSGTCVWNLGESIAYVGSTPWIIDGTIKENILMGRSWKEKRYRKVLFACDLNTDIDFLPFKDDTEVGDDGVLLSGHNELIRGKKSFWQDNAMFACLKD